MRDARHDLTERGVDVLGISPDQPEQQKKFDLKYQLGFPLLADAQNKIAKAYGVWGEKKMYGKTFMGIIRSALLIDAAGRIEKTWYKVSPKDTMPKLWQHLNQ